MTDDHSAPNCVTTPTHADGFAVTQTCIDRIVVVSVSGAVDMLTTPAMSDAISAAGAQAPVGVIVDLTAVDFLASAGMGMLVAAHGELTPAVQFGVVADGPATSRPMTLIGIDTVVPLYRTLDDALKVVGEG